MANPTYPDEAFEALIEEEAPEVRHVARVAYYDDDRAFAWPRPRRQPQPGEIARILDIVEKYISSGNPPEVPDDSWELPLPAELQAMVDAAPNTRTELDQYFKDIVDREWADSAARVHAMAVYFDELDSMSTTHLSEDVLRDLGFFAAEMRVLREKCKC